MMKLPGDGTPQSQAIGATGALVDPGAPGAAGRAFNATVATPRKSTLAMINPLLTLI